MKILVVGGAGFIGTNFCLYVKKNYPKHELIVIDNLDYSSCPKILHDNKIPLYVRDITNKHCIEHFIKNCDIAINFAAQSHNDNSFNNPKIFIETNIIGTYNLIQLCSKYNKKYHHISTDEVFGPITNSEKNHKIFTPNSNYNPTSPYSATKASSDLLVNAWIHSYNLKATITYCCNNYGPYQHIEKFIPRTITNLLSNKKPHLYGSGMQSRQWIHVLDHCAILMKIIEKDLTGKYTIGYGTEKTNIEIVKILNHYFNKTPDYYLQVKDRKYHDFSYKIDNTYVNNKINFTPLHVDLEKELQILCEWYDENRWFWESRKENIEANYAKYGQ